MEWGLRRVVPAAAVTTHAKPHARQQLALDLEVERAGMRQRCRPHRFRRGAARQFFSHVDGWISAELQLSCWTATTKAESEAETSMFGNSKMVCVLI